MEQIKKVPYFKISIAVILICVLGTSTYFATTYDYQNCASKDLILGHIKQYKDDLSLNSNMPIQDSTLIKLLDERRYLLSAMTSSQMGKKYLETKDLDTEVLMSSHNCMISKAANYLDNQLDFHKQLLTKNELEFKKRTIELKANSDIELKKLTEKICKIRKSSKRLNWALTEFKASCQKLRRPASTCENEQTTNLQKQLEKLTLVSKRNNLLIKTKFPDFDPKAMACL